jgi:hypothetical protein
MNEKPGLEPGFFCSTNCWRLDGLRVVPRTCLSCHFARAARPFYLNSRHRQAVPACPKSAPTAAIRKSVVMEHACHCENPGKWPGSSRCAR